MKTKFFAALAVVAVATLCFGTAFAEDVAPTAKAVEKKVEDKSQPTTEAVEVKTKTETPMCSMMKWIGAQVKAHAGDDVKCCGEAMKKWFDGGADVPLAGMRDQLVADGWTADSTIAFFKKMKAERAGKDCSDCSDCSGCDKAKDCGDCCGGCDKAKGEKMVKTDAATDAAPASDCGGCDKAKAKDCDCPDCPCQGAKVDPTKPAPKKDVKP